MFPPGCAGSCAQVCACLRPREDSLQSLLRSARAGRSSSRRRSSPCTLATTRVVRPIVEATRSRTFPKGTVELKSWSARRTVEGVVDTGAGRGIGGGSHFGGSDREGARGCRGSRGEAESTRASSPGGTAAPLANGGAVERGTGGGLLPPGLLGPRALASTHPHIGRNNSSLAPTASGHPRRSRS